MSGCNPEKKKITPYNLKKPTEYAAPGFYPELSGSAVNITPGKNRSKDLVQLGLGVIQCVRDFKVNQAASKKKINLELTSLR